MLLLLYTVIELVMDRVEPTIKLALPNQVTERVMHDGIAAEVMCHHNQFDVWCVMTTGAGTVLDSWRAVRLPGGFYRLKEF